MTDAPASGLVKELLELHPDAKVICTVRDPDAWVKSMDTVQNASTLWFLGVVLLPLPGRSCDIPALPTILTQYRHVRNAPLHVLHRRIAKAVVTSIRRA